MKTPLVVTLALLVAGCGTLLSSNPQVLPITSDPAGAKVSVDGQEKGVTPIEVSLPVEKDYEIKVEADGYPAATRIVQRQLSVGYIVLDVLFGLVPLAVDVLTDSLHHLDPDDLHFQFAEPKPAPAPALAAPAAVPGVTMPEMPAMPEMPEVNVEVNTGGDARSRLRDRRAARKAEREASESGGADAHCCLNGRYYDCPGLGAAAKCAPPELAGCLMGCGIDMSCPEKCLEKHKPDPSDCNRKPGKDSQC